MTIPDAAPASDGDHPWQNLVLSLLDGFSTPRRSSSSYACRVLIASGRVWSVAAADVSQGRFRAKFYRRNAPENFTYYTVESTALV
jgi:hypothetical protein